MSRKPNNSVQAHRDLLNAVGIRRVVCVDDEHGRGVEVGDIVAWALANTSSPALKHAIGGKDLNPDGPDFGEDLRQELEHDRTSELRSKLDEIVQKSGMVDDVVALKELDELLSGGPIEYLKLSPADWEREKSALIDDARGGGVLFLFDQDLGTGRAQMGASYIQDAIALAAGDKGALFIGLLSHSIPKEGEQEWMERQGYVFEVGVTPISKKGILEPDNLGRRLKLTLLRPGCRELQGAVLAAVKSAHDSVSNEVERLYELAFDQIVLQVSEHEGAWEPDAVIRIYEAIIRNKARSELRSSPALQEALPRLRDMSRRLKQVTLTKDDPRVSVQTKKLQRLERFDGGDFVNPSMLPIEIGDIFADGSGRKFILVAPQCDLMVRSDGARKAFEGTLIEIVDTRPSQVEKEERMKVELKFFHAATGQSAYADLRTATAVKLWVLDLCAFNEDGMARITLGAKVPNGHTSGWTECYRHVLNTHAVPAYQEGRTLQATRRALAKAARNSPGNRTLRPSALGRIQGSLCAATTKGLFRASARVGTLTFDVRRMDRLVTPLAYELYRAFHAYQARTAEEPSMDMP